MYTEALEILVKLLKLFEGCKLRAYKDIVGVWTIGYGETLNVVEGMEWSQEYAEERLRVRAMEFLRGVLKACPMLGSMPPNRLAACASLAYNIGLPGFRGSSVCRLVKSGEIEAAAKKFLLWNKAGGKVVRGLTLRRELEMKKFLEA